MERFRILHAVLAVACVAPLCGPMSASLQAQPGQDDTAGLKVRQLHPPSRPALFPSGSEGPGRVHTIEFRPAGEMTEKDRNLEADAEQSIREHARFVDLEFNEGKWAYQQIVCPALPNHMLLQFTRNNGVGDTSVFSAAIPRGGEGRVRIVPIVRRGYSLFSPAPINALTISAFNHIRGEEHAERAPDWLTLGMCYAALAGAHPVASLLAENEKTEKFPEAMPALLETFADGGAAIRFADTAARPRAMEWTMTFDKKGKLLKATHTPAAMIRERPLGRAAAESKAKPLNHGEAESGKPQR